MSRVGKMPINIPANVKVALDGNTITVSGPLGELKKTVDSKISMELKDGQLVLSRSSDEKDARALHGLFRALLANMVTGVSTGFTKTLIVAGVGYKVSVQGDKLVMNLGLSHPVEFVAPKGIKITAPDNFTIVVSGVDKELVGEVAAKIRETRPVEPYHLYGIHYNYEKLSKKEGKKAGAAGGKK